MTVKRVLVPLAIVLAIALCVGCGGDKSATSEIEGAASEAVEAAGEAAESAAAAADEAVEDGKGAIESLKAELAEKEDEFAKLAEKIKGLSPADMGGSVGQDLMAKSEALSGEIQALKDKIASYM